MPRRDAREKRLALRAENEQTELLLDSPNRAPVRRLQLVAVEVQLPAVESLGRHALGAPVGISVGAGAGTCGDYGQHLCVWA